MMATVEEILGPKPQEEVTVESILGPRPMTEEPTKKISVIPGNEREQFLRDQYQMTGEMYPIGKETEFKIPAEIEAIPPTLWKLVKTHIPGGKLLSEEFKQSPWWLKKTDLPSDFDNVEFSPLDILALSPVTSPAYFKLSPTELAKKYREFKKKGKETELGTIIDEIQSLESFIFFPLQMKMLGEFVGPVVSKYAPTVYKVFTNRLRWGKWWKEGEIIPEKMPGKIPEIEIKPEIEPIIEPKIKIEKTAEELHKDIRSIQQQIIWKKDYSNLSESEISQIAKNKVIETFGSDIDITLYRGISPELRPSPFESDTIAKVGKFWSSDISVAKSFAGERGEVYQINLKASNLANPKLVQTVKGEKPFEKQFNLSPEALKGKIKPTQKIIEPEQIPEPGQKFSEPEGVFESTVKYDPHQAMAEAGTESMIAKGIKRDPNKLMTEQLVEEWLKDPSKYENIVAKYGMTPQEWAGIMREQASSWGRKLGELGIEARKLGKEIPEFGEAMDELAAIARIPSAWDKIQNGWKNIDRVRRGLLVTQLSTAMRNGFSQAGRVGLDVPEKAMNYYLAKLFGMEPKGSPLDGVEQLFKILQRGESKKIAEGVLEAFPKQYSRLYSTYMSDIEIGKAGQTISRGVDILNTANRFQEFLYRNGVFRASLEQELKKSGMDLVKIIESKTIQDIPKEAVEKSVSKALEMTFAETSKYGTIGKKFIDFVTSMPGATFILPFPRFMLNSLKFNFEYSPMGLLKLLSPAERAAFAAGDVHVMSRAIMGTVMLGTAWQIRNSEYAGEKWNELKVGGKTINMMSYNPFAVYLFIADIIKKTNDGTLHKLTGKDVSMGILSSNLRAGVGLYALDEVINGLSKTGDPEKAANVLKTFAGETAGGVLTPLNQVKELLVGFDDYVVKSKREEPFMGPIKEKIPFVEKTLPALYSATREGPVTRELSAMRQLTGLMTKTKNPFEKELDRLGFSYQEIFRSTGDPEADNTIKKYMGIMAQNMVIPMIESEEYKALTEGQKGLVLANLLNEIRSTAKEAAEEENPNLFVRIRLERIPQRERRVMEEQGLDIRELEKQLTQ